MTLKGYEKFGEGGGGIDSWFPKQPRKSKSVTFFNAGKKVEISNFISFSLKVFVTIPVKGFGRTNVSLRQNKFIQCCRKPCHVLPCTVHYIDAPCTPHYLALPFCTQFIFNVLPT